MANDEGVKVYQGTRVYGSSDDLIEFDGDLRGEVDGGSADDDCPLGDLVAFSDGTVLAVRYGKPAAGGVWAIDVLVRGSMFARHEVCTDEDADPYSDQVFFAGGKLKAWKASHAQVVR